MTFDPHWLAYPLLGVAVGFFAGLLGVGGGGIMVPMLTSIFLSQGVPKDQVGHLALGTSMAAIVITSLSSLRAHHAHGAVLWPVVRRITPGILVGTFLGTFLAAQVKTAFLAIFFAVFMTYVAVQMLVGFKPKPSRELPGTLGLTGVGLGIGGVSSLVAIGGGSLSVPFMTYCNVKVQHAIGTSAAIGFPIALAGTLGYLLNGLGHEGMPPLSIGFIYVPALVLIAVTSSFTAPLGARLAHKLPVATLKRVFALVLLMLCAKMLADVFG
ncbi:MAG: sulfite exporter TauE/SafE family protein [Myxococcales bacterium]|nr:sulfite exporter TauE/SafE family protein [Myxococcales bacterium]